MHHTEQVSTLLSDTGGIGEHSECVLNLYDFPPQNTVVYKVYINMRMEPCHHDYHLAISGSQLKNIVA